MSDYKEYPAVDVMIGDLVTAAGSRARVALILGVNYMDVMRWQKGSTQPLIERGRMIEKAWFRRAEIAQKRFQVETFDKKNKQSIIEFWRGVLK